MAKGALTLMRIGPDANGEESGYLKVMWTGDIFSTRENDATLKKSSLRVGIYPMTHSWKKFNLDGTPCKPIKCLRPVETAVRSILIHRAANDNPNTLQGCIAPGIIGDAANWQDSEEAMEKLWTALGGFEENKEVNLVVLTNATGVGFLDGKIGWRGFQ